MFSTEINVNLKCDNPDCPVNFVWVDITEEQARRGETPKIPDGAFRFIMLADPLGYLTNPMGHDKWTFCSKYCLLEFMKTWVTRKSPREQLEAVEEKRKEIEEKEKQAAKIETLTEDREIGRLVGEGGIG